jgi:RNA polymerase sigma-70 factor (family 1)
MAGSTNITGENYLNLFQSGCEKGFDYYFRQLYTPACYFTKRLLLTAEPCSDIVQDSFIQLWQHRDKIQTEQGLRGYLYTCIYHACLRWKENRQRQLKHETAAGYPADASIPGYIEIYISTEIVKQIHQAIDELPAGCRKVFTRMYIEGKGIKEIARELQVSVSTVKSQKSRGITILRTKLKPH